MRKYTFQEALSQCKVNGMIVTNVYGDLMFYSDNASSMEIKCTEGSSIVFLDDVWFEYKEEEL